MNAARTDTGSTALTYASEQGHLGIARLLLNRGANVNAATADGGYTALMYASTNGRLSTVQLLLASGANKDAMSTAGQTALALASTPEIKHVLK